MTSREGTEPQDDYRRFSRQVIEHAREGIVVYGTDLHYRLWNPYMETITGFSSAEVLGRHPLELFPFLREAGVIDQLRRILREGVQDERQFPYELPRTGASGWASDVSAPLRDEEGEIIGVISFIRDITRRKEAEDRLRESEEQFRGMVETVREGIWTIDREGYTTLVNPKMTEMLGYTAEEMRGRHVFSFIAPQTMEEAREKLSRGKAGVREQFELLLQRKDGTTLPVLLGTAPLFDEQGQYDGSLGAVMDISDLKRAQEELRAEKERAEEADRLKSAFLANMSHEIRTPLNAIIGFIDLALLDADISGEVKESLQQAKQSSNELISLMDNIIDLAKLETGQLQVSDSELPLASILENATERGESLVRETGKAISIRRARPSGAEQIYPAGDAQRIGQILSLLMDNAVKFTREGRIELEVNFPPEGLLEISLHDTGIGISPEAQDYIFSPFRQADEEASRGYGGLGLGLAVAKRLSMKLGGDLRVESVPGEGSTFTCTLPYGTQ